MTTALVVLALVPVALAWDVARGAVHAVKKIEALRVRFGPGRPSEVIEGEGRIVAVADEDGTTYTATIHVPHEQKAEPTR